MKIVVLVKQVPDPNALRLDPREGALQPGTPQVPNEYDLAAVEAAVRLAEARGDVEVVVGSVGHSKETVNRCLAMGADRAVLIEAPSEGRDSLATAKILAGWLRDEGYDLILAGQEASDGATGNVGPQLAALLDLPVVSNVIGLEDSDGALRLKREIEDGHQIVQVTPPAILCALTALNEPRHPSLKGIMAARRKPTDTKQASEVGVSDPAGASVVAWGKLFTEEETAEGTIVSGEDVDNAIDQLVAFLKEEKLI